MKKALPILTLFLLLGLPALAAPPGTVAVPNVGSTSIEWEPIVSHAIIGLTVTGPEETCIEEDYEQGANPRFKIYDENGELRPDGVYTWELRVTPKFTAEDRALRKQEREQDPGSSFKQLSVVVREEAVVQSGSFRILEGRLVDPEVNEKAATVEAGLVTGEAKATGFGDGPLTLAPTKDFVINDDLIVDGSACIGFDCVNGESFGFDTIRLKENNLRIKFDDTSVAASFPRTDWQLTANASANGGASKFSIDDISGSRTPFTVEANARSHSLYVDDGGRIGNRTSTPSTEIHTIDGDTPTLRLQQDGSSGFTPQTWDVAGNETNFFIRDVTNGSTLPFRIRPSAPTSSIFIDTDGKVGLGTASPDDMLHVQGIAAENPGIRIVNPDANGGAGWSFRVVDINEFRISESSTGGPELSLDINGNLAVTGTISSGGTQLNVPDYVFEADYELMPLPELAEFVATRKHLPNIPSASDINGSGQLNMTDMQMRLLEKVEELTLYTLAQEETISELNQHRDQQSQLIARLEARLAALEEGRGNSQP